MDSAPDEQYGVHPRRSVAKKLTYMFAKIQRIHFVGIGGIGMSGIAEVLLNLGYKVSGSDLKTFRDHAAPGRPRCADIRRSQAENIAGAEVVVTSSAIAPAIPRSAKRASCTFR